METALGNTYLHAFNYKCILRNKQMLENCRFYLFISCLCTRWLFMIYEDAQGPEKRRARMIRPQWLIVAPRVLRQMELLSWLLLRRELTSFLKLLLHISVGIGLPNFPTPSPCISYVHINESSGGFWTRCRAGGLLYGQALQVERWRFYWTLFCSGSAKKKHTFSDFYSPGFKLVWVYVFAFKKMLHFLQNKIADLSVK